MNQMTIEQDSDHSNTTENFISQEDNQTAPIEITKTNYENLIGWTFESIEKLGIQNNLKGITKIYIDHFLNNFPLTSLYQYKVLTVAALKIALQKTSHNNSIHISDFIISLSQIQHLSDADIIQKQTLLEQILQNKFTILSPFSFLSMIPNISNDYLQLISDTINYCLVSYEMKDISSEAIFWGCRKYQCLQNSVDQKIARYLKNKTQSLNQMSQVVQFLTVQIQNNE